MARKPSETKAAPTSDAKVAEAADTVAAGAILGAGAVEREGGDANQTVAGAIGGAAAAETVTGADEPSGVVPAVEEGNDESTDLAADGATTADAAPSDASATSATTPVAPGDEPDAVFARRIERLNLIVADAEFEGGTLFGDLRTLIRDLFIHRPKVWAAMPPSERQDMDRAIEAVAKQVLERVVLVVAQEDSVTIQATLLADFTTKNDTVTAKIKIEGVDEDGVVDVYRLAGHRVVIIDAAAKRFMATRRATDHGKDQTEMTFGDDTRGAAPAPKPEPQPGPEGDHDLVDAAEDDEEDGGEEEPGNAGDSPAALSDDATFGVFDTQDGDWLVDLEPEPEEWARKADKAKRFTNDEARRIAGEYGDGFEARLLD